MLFSSYVDDIAFIKILCGARLLRHPQLQGRVVHYFVLFLSWFGLFITCDWIFLAVGIFILRCKRVVSMYYCCFGLYHFVVDFWSEEIFAK